MLRKLIIITCLFLIASISIGYAHDWYPLACCSNQDCHPIACEAIIEKGTYLFYHGHEFAGSMIKPSQDGQCHACIMNELKDNAHPMCIFIQQGS